MRPSLAPSLHYGNTATMNIKHSVKLPPGEDVNEWIAMNTIEVYNTMNLCYGIVSEFCTAQSCPCMTAGPKVTYFWADQSKGIKPVSLPAPEYIEKVVSWISEQFDNPSIFPEDSSEFTKNFLPCTTKIWTRMFRIYAHIYHCHWEKVKVLGAVVHINSCFKHFYYFSSEFDLIDPKDMEPMQNIIEKLEK
eukprot:Phypoly_transcript_18638.p1 GENE.Phypoly_transcript_18638~~Phypoly_transcript_18638.p1  ORF type:complete len:191 (+),score=16.83 Phypoly_transcript_18638:114-686(+)